MDASSKLTEQAPLTWARARLRLGISNVGTWVLVAVAVLFLQPAVPDGARGWGLIVLAQVALQAPFDVIGGWLLPRRFGRPAASPLVIGRGVLVQALFSFLLGAVVLQLAAFSVYAVAAAWLAVVIGMIAGQGLIARVVAPLPSAALTPAGAERLLEAGLEPGQVRVVDAVDRSFVGGWVGLPGAATLVVPAGWLTRLPGVVADVALRRRVAAISSGARFGGVVGAAIYTGIGLALVLGLVPGAWVTTPSGLLHVAAGSTLWSFVGVLTLPRLSSQAVLGLDGAVSKDVGAMRVVSAIWRLDEDQEAEPARGPVIEGVFHPVPSPTRRGEALTGAKPALHGPWRVARTALYLGWANGSWLGRAVHCNIGRPELWVLFPGD